ncbi:glutathione transferase omega [Phanerochaete sordida]|uniref:Glutathione transferase omega n=1 Tax=Phanerochaete sordida TaxID=48140 RepID=A0A9P3LKD4_9APHY|nr:glutathione transferase omega [Phanerochaete sordida]
MVQTEQITFYTHVYSPYCHRVHLALEEAKADYTICSINLMDKPKWYTEKVNPTGKIPALAYGGPKPAEDAPPSDTSVKLRESLVLLEFLADLFPGAELLPADAVQRAQARLFTGVAEGALFEGFKAYFFMREPAQKLLDALDALQAALPADKPFAVGDKWCIADMAAAPFLARIVLLLEQDLGVYPAGEGVKTLAVIRGEKYARLNKYIEDVKAQPSFKATWDEATQIAIWSSNPMFKRD